MRRSIVHEAEDKLNASSHLLRNNVECEYLNGVLVIRGRVPSFYLKQTAQTLIQGIEGVSRVENDIQVVNPYGISSEPALCAS